MPTFRFHNFVLFVATALLPISSLFGQETEDRKKDGAFINRVTDELDVRQLVKRSGKAEMSLGELLDLLPPRSPRAIVTIRTGDFGHIHPSTPKVGKGKGSEWQYWVERKKEETEAELMRETHHEQAVSLKINSSMTVQYVYLLDESGWPERLAKAALPDEIFRVNYDLNTRALSAMAGKGLTVNQLPSLVPPPRFPVRVNGREMTRPGSHHQFGWTGLLEMKGGQWSFDSVQNLETRIVTRRDQIRYVYPFTPLSNQR